MEENKISLFKELYYWMYFYGKKISKFPVFPIDFAAFILLTESRMINLFSLCVLVNYFLKLREKYLLELVIVLFFILFWLDLFLFYKKRGSIIPYCEQFSKRKRNIGKIKFWTYIIFSILLFRVAFFCIL